MKMKYAASLNENYKDLTSSNLWEVYCFFSANQDNGCCSPEDLSKLHIEVGKRMMGGM
jgi:hypothetical protein